MAGAVAVQTKGSDVLLCLDVACDGVFELGNGFEDAAADSSASDRREKPFDGVEPGGDVGVKWKVHRGCVASHFKHWDVCAWRNCR